MNPRLRTAIRSLAILGGLIGVAVILMNTSPEPMRKPPDLMPRLTVDVKKIVTENYQTTIKSYGKVEPRTQTTLVAEVSGKIVWIKPEFKDGGFFAKDEILVKLDDRNYRAEVAIAKATVAEMRQALLEEEAKGQEALENWHRLGSEDTASDLTLRRPQLETAQARFASATAKLTLAELNLERTQIKAPYEGRILSTAADIGQYIGPNTQLASVYSTDLAEVRMPICNCDLNFINLPESGHFSQTSTIEVVLNSNLGGEREWVGVINRTEAAIDEESRQLHVVTQIDHPFAGNKEGKPPIKIGEYVTATIQGRVIENAIVIPSKTIYQGNTTYVVIDDMLEQRTIDVLWQNGEVAIINSGLNEGDLLVTTPLGQVTSGTLVSIMGSKPNLPSQNTPQNNIPSSANMPAPPGGFKP